MPYLVFAFFAQDDCYHVEAARAFFYVIYGKKMACGPDHSGFFGFGDRRLGGAEIFVSPGLYLDKDKRAVFVYHNQVDFAGFAGEITSEGFEAFAFEEFLAAFLAPSAAQLFVRRRPSHVRQQISYSVYRIDLVILRLCARCAAGRA